MRRLALLAFLLELGWLAMWPLSGALSHSPPFTAALLDNQPAVRQPFQITLSIAQLLVPGLPAAPLSDPLGADSFLVPATTLAALMLWLAVIYLAALRLLSNRLLGSRKETAWLVLGAALVFQATLLFQPGLFSQDVFSYIAYGRLAAVYDLNPYVWPPSAIASDVVLPWVAEVWRTYPAPYGPLWLDVQWLMSRATDSLPVADQALAYRVLASALLLANLGLAWQLLGRLTALDRPERTTALAALAWNPLLLFEVAGNAHNDALMVSFSLLALLWLAQRQPSNVLLSAVSLSLGALDKYLCGLGLVWLAVAFAARSGGWRRRTIRVLTLVGVCGALALAFAAPWLELPDSLEPLLAETTTVGYVNALPDSLTLFIVDRGVAPGQPTLELARLSERLLVLVAFTAYLTWETRRVLCSPSAACIARATARASLLYVLVVATSMQPWYLCLPLSLAVVLGCRSSLARVAIGYSLLALPALYLHYYLRGQTPAWVDVVYALGPLVALTPALQRRAGARRHGPAAEIVGHDVERAGRHAVAAAVMEQGGR
jgi:hypothetical protein